MTRLRLFFILIVVFVADTSFYNFKSKSAYYIVIDKSSYELNVYDAEGWLIAYPVVFGNNDQGDKLMEGDRKTPEGAFTIISKRVHNKWCRYMGLDFPTAADINKFKIRKQQGLIPGYARQGGGIGIHGTWPREENAVDEYQNWTEGCISMKNEHVKQLFNIVSIGTRVIIQK